MCAYSSSSGSLTTGGWRSSSGSVSLSASSSSASSSLGSRGGVVLPMMVTSHHSAAEKFSGMRWAMSAPCWMSRHSCAAIVVLWAIGWASLAITLPPYFWVIRADDKLVSFAAQLTNGDLGGVSEYINAQSEFSRALQNSNQARSLLGRSLFGCFTRWRILLLVLVGHFG